MKKYLLLFICFCSVAGNSFSQDMTLLVNKVKAKLDAVNDYTATGKMKTDIAFIKAPLSSIIVYYKKPDLFKLKRNGGISVLPKSGVSVNINSMLTMDKFAAINAGKEIINNVSATIVKMLPLDENSDVILTTLYIDEKNLLVLRAVSTTKDKGTYQIDMTYRSYASYGLPDKVVFSFDMKNYKMPKGVTMENDPQQSQADLDRLKNKKGRIEITYSSYIINKGIDSSVFK